MNLRVCFLISLFCAAPVRATLCQSSCTSLPGSLIEVGDPANPNYVGFTFKYAPGTTFADQSQAGGISIGDFDNDGYEDIAFAGGVNQAILLAQNQHNGKFIDVAATKGLTNKAQRGGALIFFDYDNDGDLDIISVAHAFGAGSQLFRLYRNAGPAGAFVYSDVTSIASFALDPGTVETTSGGFLGGVTVGDYDQDGFLDVFACWENTALGSPQNDMWRLFSSQPNPNGATNNPAVPTDSPRIFVDHTVAAGLNINLDSIPDVDGGAPGEEAWQPTFVDMNNDGWPDLHVCADFGGDFMFINDRNGSFTDVATPTGMNGIPPKSRDEMGACFSDVDNDGDLDVRLTNLAFGKDNDPLDPKVWADRFYRNDSSNGQLIFTDMAAVTGVINSEWGWGTIAFDYENDGDLDQVSVSGYRLVDDPFLNRLHINQYPATASDGVSPLFCDATSLVPQFSHGPLGDDISRNVEALDIDNDGDLDLVVGKCVDATSSVPIKRTEFFLNTQNLRLDWLKVDLIGENGSLDTVNARVWLRTRGVTQHRQVLAGTSFHGQDSARQHFGLGANGATKLMWMVVRWPGANGKFEYIPDVTADRVNTIRFDDRRQNELGDLNVDGKVDATDVSMLILLIHNPALYNTLYPDSPGLVLGDIDEDNSFTIRDLMELLLLKR